MANKKKGLWFRIVVCLGIILLAAGTYSIYKAYSILYKTNVKLDGKKHEYFYIHTGADFAKVTDSLHSKNILINNETFDWLANYKDYKDHVKPGKYLVTDGMSNNELINMLKSGKQEAVKLVFNNVRTRFQLAGKIAKQLEADSLSIMNMLDDSIYLKKSGFTSANALVVFIPNTYEMYWNTSAKQLFGKMSEEYKNFWTDDRKEKAMKANLTPVQAEILASIVQEETAQYDEMSRIAGLYINRLNKGMKMEADPTVKFAVGDFSIKRVLKRHLDVESPYNTYRHIGLPPGPISLPDPRVIDKVLDFEKHDFLYMCAKEDFSGYHNFARTAAEHAANARRYQNALNRLKIK
ncbi:MAG: endolytic transglycosylase MltG [Bacteroidales bacterium]|jgi:UPF0755 protein